MKAGAATREPEIEAFWEAEKIYEQSVALRKQQGATKFILHDGPPYLSSDKIHIGTALNKILKDIVTRYQYQKGHYAPYVPGYDSHGLPIENAVVKNLKGGRHSVSEAELRKLCREFALKNLDGQEANFKRLGVWGDWKHPYITMNAAFEARQITLFYEMYKKNYVYKGLKPVYWCPTCETALAEAEVEYDNHLSHSVYVKFPIDDESVKASAIDPEVKEQLIGASFVIWTTTPWTLPANLALAVNPDFYYQIWESGKYGRIVVAKELLLKMANEIGANSDEIQNLFSRRSITGNDLEGLKGVHPFLNRRSPVLCGTHVTLEAGTGIVHTAPGHGMEDYVMVQKYNNDALKDNPLPVLSPLDNRGIFVEGDYELPAELVGQHYEKANDIVIEILKSQNALITHKKFEHSYPHCWRCHKPVIYRATDQWFININDIRQQSLAAIKGVKWIPEKGESRITSMVENRTDWCISRQRVWGVPIPIFYDADTREIVIGDEIIEHLYQLFKEHTSDIWWAQSAEALLAGLPQAVKDKYNLTGRTLEKEMDIMDVWFDSGVTHTTVVEERGDELGDLPVELYLEGSDQHRGWFQSSLLTSVMLHGIAPYEKVLTHGFVLDQDGRKMSKSLGNVVDPNKVMNQYGADILRLWVASVDYTVDIKIGDHILAQLAETYKKVRNTFRFMLGNLSDFNPVTDAVFDTQLSNLDRYVLYRLQGLVSRVTADFDKYEFHRYNHEIQYFCGNDLSSLYFDITKDILYCDGKNSPRRQAVQTVIHQTLLTLLPMLVPIMPHLAEDIWQNLPDALKGNSPPASVTLLDWPTVSGDHSENSARLETSLILRNTVLMALEGARSEGKIGSALDAKIIITGLDGADLDELTVLCLTSQIELQTDAPVEYLSKSATTEYPLIRASEVVVYVVPAQGAECARCWKHDVAVGKNAAHPTLCARCLEAVG